MGMLLSRRRNGNLSVSENITKAEDLPKSSADTPVEPAEPKAEMPKVTKTEISRMSTAELKKFAKANGIKDADAKSGAELKKILIEKLF